MPVSRYMATFFGTKDISELEKALLGVKMEEAAILAAVGDIDGYIAGLRPEELAGLILNG